MHHAWPPLEVGEEVWLGEVGVDVLLINNHIINLYSLIRLGQVGVDVLGALPEEALEAVAAPLDGVPNSELITSESRE